MNSVTTAMKDVAATLRGQLGATQRFPLILRLTLVMLVWYGGSSAPLAIPVRVTSAILLVVPDLITNQLFWWLLVATTGLGNVANWHLIDNHQYLITYWTVACACALGADSPPKTLRRSAQLLISLVFVLAVFWKLWAQEYVDGTFIHVTFLMDPRIQRLGAAAAGQPVGQVSLISDAIRFLGSRGMDGVDVAVGTGRRLQLVSEALSWMALLVEAAIAGLFMVSAKRLYSARHLALMGFIALTYSLVPVVGFAFVLAVLGVAQCEESDRQTVAHYVLLIACVQLTVVPWQALLIGGR